MFFSNHASVDAIPIKSVIVCSTGRSGSTLLCTTLKQLNCAGTCREFFLPETLTQNSVSSSAQELYRYLSQIYRAGTSPNGVFGIKLHWDHMKVLTQLARTDPALAAKSNIELLNLFFPDPSFIFIRRRNVTKQAISAAIGYQTGVFVVPKSVAKQSATDQKQLIFNPLNIYRYKQGLIARNNNWRAFFKRNNLPFFEVVYEDLVAEFEATVRQTLDFAGINLPDDAAEIVPVIKKQSNQINERWYQYYRLIPEGLLSNYSELRSILRKALSK